MTSKSHYFPTGLIIRNLREHVKQCSEHYTDEGTADFLTGLMERYEDAAWMLRSFIEGEALEGRTATTHQVNNTPAGV